MKSSRDLIRLLTISTRYYIIYIRTKSRLDMNDYDASTVWDYEISCHDNLDENYAYNMQDTYDLDEEYARDTHNYTELAYTHYA